MTPNQIQRTSPFDHFRTMNSLMDRLFPWNTETATDMPALLENLALDVYEKDGNVVVKAALPGVKQEDVKINVTDDVLQISAERKDESEVRKADYYLKECSTGTWFRSVRLPADLMAEKATATYADGYLTLTIPRKPTSKPRSIEVKVG